MRRARVSIVCLTFLSLTLAGGLGAARGAESEAEIALQRALDQPLTLTLDNVELASAFKQIAAAAKISPAQVEVDAACFDDLPYGSTVKVSAEYRQSTVRDALEYLLVPLGLQQTIVRDKVLIRPSGPLAHIGRRADWDDLKLLKELRTGADIKPQARSPLDLTLAIRGALETRKDLIVSIANDSGAAHDRAIEQIQKQLPMSPFRALEMYCQLTNQIWFAEGGPGGETGGRISIMPERQWIQRQLERPINLSLKAQPLSEVVDELTRASGIRFVPEPGLYKIVQDVSLKSSNGSVQQALEALAGAAQIAFEIRDDSILLHLAPAPGNQPPPSDTIVGRITVPVGPSGTLMDIFIREADLPPDVDELRKKKLQEAIDGLQKDWTAPVLPPAASATAPAAHPATAPAGGGK